jgi:hypothetical protein
MVILSCENSSLYWQHYCKITLSFHNSFKIILPSNGNYHLVMVLPSSNTDGVLTKIG